MGFGEDRFRRKKRWSIFDEVDRMFEDMFKETFESLYPRDCTKSGSFLTEVSLGHLDQWYTTIP